jgi:hypothetical protein
MGLSTWFFIRPRPGGLQPVALRRIEAFFDGDGHLPADDDGRVQYVEVIVRLEDRRAVEVVRMSFFQCRAQADGTLDRRHYMQLMATAGEAAFGGMAVSKAPPGVVSAEHKFAQRRLDHLTHWTPTEAEVEMLRGLVNRKARRELL